MTEQHPNQTWHLWNQPEPSEPCGGVRKPEEYREESDVEIDFTADGIVVHAFYEDVVCMGGPVLIPWAEVDARRAATR